MSKDVIIALDFSSKEEALNFLSTFDNKPFVKVGMELFYKEGKSIVNELKKRGHKVFLDLKLHDIPNTVEKGIKNLSSLGVDFITIHASGGREMIESAVKATKKTNTKILAVSVLTSLDNDMIKEMGYNNNLENIVCSLAKIAEISGAYGMISSPKEVQIIKNNTKLKSISPGIILIGGNVNDQKRITTPKKAKEFGSDYIVVGRAITSSDNPYNTYKCICKDFLN